MFKTMKTKFAVMMIVGGIVSGATLASPAYAKHHAQESKTEAVSTESAQKLALGGDGVANEQATVVTDGSFKSVKSKKSARPAKSNYFDVENYNFDMSGTSSCVGI